MFRHSGRARWTGATPRRRARAHDVLWGPVAPRRGGTAPVQASSTTLVMAARRLVFIAELGRGCIGDAAAIRDARELVARAGAPR
jgi:hypothetical protein